MSTDDAKQGALTRRCIAIVSHLSGHVVNGMSNKDLAAAVGCSPANVTRAADLLRDEGWVEKDETTGRFRITTRFSRLAVRVMVAFDQAEADLASIRRNYTLEK